MAERPITHNGPNKPIRACTNCVRSKAKCAPITDAIAICERCYRMKKDCQPSPPMRKRRAAGRFPGDKVKVLEKKLDGLVDLIKAGSSLATAGGSSVNSTGQGLGPSHRATDADDNIQKHTVGSNPNASDETQTTSSTLAAPVTSHPLIPPSLEPDPEISESYLFRFRTVFLPNMPFLIIPPYITAKQLREDSPLLWLSVMTVACTRPAQQIGLSKAAREIFGREGFVEGTRNMDFLLAVLVYITWNRRYPLEKPISTGLVQLAITIVYDLGLDKPSVQHPGLKRPTKPVRKSPSLEDRRVLLGCYLTSTIVTSHGKGESLHRTAYIDECVHILEARRENPSDTLLVQLVKLRLIAEKAMDYTRSHLINGYNASPQSPWYLRSLQQQLRSFKSNVPDELANNKILLLELYNAELKIHEIGFSPAPEAFPAQSNLRVDCLQTYMLAVKSWLDTFLTIPPAEYVGISALMYTSMTNCFVGLYRLLTFEHAEWDHGLVQESVNIPQILEEMAGNFARVKEAASLDLTSQDLDYYSTVAAKIWAIKASWDAALSETQALEHGDFSELLDMWSW
ncbi:hypothetical protein BDV25DRAFT_140027 [Aspergillus avenaceus]|uniref:Zn(2)-C6 fungal-type domain-containing protein n=1 Tax=Aspergillus avenaceus TaxID=36643 RepID=A0A5N6TVE3_ASPAV|nr:hypothetical protein BDV25DRAFT_140027 [Aspergillus avenaceus]